MHHSLRLFPSKGMLLFALSVFVCLASVLLHVCVFPERRAGWRKESGLRIGEAAWEAYASGDFKRAAGRLVIFRSSLSKQMANPVDNPACLYEFLVASERLRRCFVRMGDKEAADRLEREIRDLFRNMGPDVSMVPGFETTSDVTRTVDVLDACATWGSQNLRTTVCNTMKDDR